MDDIKKELETYCELHWWNMGKKTLSFKGYLKGLLENQKVTFTKKKSEINGLYIFKFKNTYGMTFEVKGQMYEFPHFAKQFVQMNLVRMGDKSQLYVNCFWRPTVNVNF